NRSRPERIAPDHHGDVLAGVIADLASLKRLRQAGDGAHDRGDPEQFAPASLKLCSALLILLVPHACLRTKLFNLAWPDIFATTINICSHNKWSDRCTSVPVI